MTGNVENKNNNPVNIRFVDKTSDIRNFSENIRQDLMLKYQKWQHWSALFSLLYSWLYIGKIVQLCAVV